jgi:hypothetical protein
MTLRHSLLCLTPLLSLLLSACFGARVEVDNPRGRDFSIAAGLASWQQVLDAHVDQRGMVDFQALAADPDDLDHFVAVIANADLEPLDDSHTLAFHINAYNALAMKGILIHDIPESLSGMLDRAGFFKGDEYRIAGAWWTLSAYENEVIRDFPEPRLHAAINCMSLSCPRLRQEAYAGDRLDAQLAAAMFDFVTDQDHVRYDPTTDTVHLSKILEWYRADFPGESGADLIAYLNRWRQDPIPTDATVTYNDYDWTVISQR